MKSPVHAFLWMLLAKQGQLANGLYNVKFHPVIRQRVMNRRTCHDRHAAGGELIKVIGKQFGQPHIMAYGNQTFGKTVQRFNGDGLPLLCRIGLLLYKSKITQTKGTR
jgi:hypothetical protein